MTLAEGSATTRGRTARWVPWAVAAVLVVAVVFVAGWRVGGNDVRFLGGAVTVNGVTSYAIIAVDCCSTS